MEDRKLTERESLEVITSMIALTKQRYIGDGRILLLFGYLTVAVSALMDTPRDYTKSCVELAMVSCLDYWRHRCFDKGKETTD